jgi:pilus assembly protein CpaE
LPKDSLFGENHSMVLLVQALLLMPLDTTRFETPRQSAWPWRAGLVVNNPQLADEIAAALSEVRAACVFQVAASAPIVEIFALIERDSPDLLFVELSATSVPSIEWMASVQNGDGSPMDGSPMVVAVHASADPEQMIGALRAGATEFLSLPMSPGIFEALDRIGARLQSAKPAESPQGKIIGIVSAKGGCGATTLACHIGLALGLADPSRKILVADLDYQSPAVHRICQLKPRRRAGETFESVRKLNSSNWAEFFTPVAPSVDILAGPEAGNTTLPEPWRIESLFRHLTRCYPLVLADLGRHLNPGTWSFLQHVDELLVVAAPDVLALYQTRYIIQALTSRGFDRGRLRLVLNLSQNTPRDFWIESIEQMFEMKLFAVIPADRTALPALMPGPSKPSLSFPAETPFGKSVVRLADRLSKDENISPTRRAA